MLNTPGTIDHGYRGEVGVILINHGRARFDVQPGMKIAQMVIASCLTVSVEEIGESERHGAWAGRFRIDGSVARRGDLARGQYSITTDPQKLDLDAIHAFLSRSFWAEGIPKDTVARAMANSLCFGLFDGAGQIGFARVVTDRATYAYLCDVYVLESHRGLGLGKWLIETVMAHPDLQGLRRFQLVTRDAHGLYSRHGFDNARRSRSPHGNFQARHVSRGQRNDANASVARTLSFVRFSHSVFALPFALTGALLASRQHPVTWRHVALDCRRAW